MPFSRRTLLASLSAGTAQRVAQAETASKKTIGSSSPATRHSAMDDGAKGSGLGEQSVDALGDCRTKVLSHR